MNWLNWLKRLFAKKATQIDMDEMKFRVGELKDTTRTALISQKKMLDLLLAHLNLEPVTTTTAVGTEYPQKKTVTVLRKKKPAPQVKDEGDDDE